MAKPRSVYRCSECGYEHHRWVGRCDGCGAWNTVAEEPAVRSVGLSAGERRGGGIASIPPRRLDEIRSSSLVRWSSGIEDFDFVLGGGLVPGSITLIGGEPGIGKSTLLLQAIARLQQSGRKTLYASGEESLEQLELRSDRLDENAGGVLVAGDTRLEAIIQAAIQSHAEIVVVDSIQTVHTELLESAPGSVGQVRESAARLMRFAKETGTAVLVVGHVTKGGNIAGPKTLEHIVDTVLYFEGETALDFRLLRVSKNRFGPVDEIGVFTMTERGLSPVPNPSALFLGARSEGAAGSAVTALIEGTRPVLVEVQALAARSGYGTPQRVSAGLDPKRLAVILAVLERRGGVSFADLDVFIQASSGVKLHEPSADLAVAAALLSSLNNCPIRPGSLYLGEIGLSGEVRPVAGLDRRLGEAARLGFQTAYSSSRGARQTVGGIEQIGLSDVSELVQSLAA